MECTEFFKKKITVMNGVMCVLVVILHSYNMERYMRTGRFVLVLETLMSKTIANIAVPMFFFMSAILFFQNYDLKSTSKKFKSRFISCLIPYVVWNILYYIIFIILVKCPLSNEFMETKEVSINMKQIWEAIVWHKYNGAFWFIAFLMVYILVSPLIYIVIRKKAGILSVFFLVFFNMMYNGLFSYELIYWTLGGWLIIHKKEILYHKSKHSFYCLIGSLIVIAVRYCYEYVNPISYSQIISRLLLIINVILVWFGIDACRDLKEKNWMKKSFFIYALHPLIVDMIKKGGTAFLPDNGFSAMIVYGVSICGGIMICVLVAKILSRYSPHIYWILSGGRIKR